jgi:hypothetical protein
VGALLVIASPVASATAAQIQTCPNPREGDVSVQITLPAGGDVVSGVVAVEGSVTASEPVFQVELFVGEARRDVAVFDPPVAEAPFSLQWDAGSYAPGPATVRVVACGGAPAEGSLIRGEGAVDVAVEATPAGAPAGGALSRQPVRSSGLDWAPVWVGLTFGMAALAGLVYALRQSPLDHQPEAEAPPGLEPELEPETDPD